MHCPAAGWPARLLISTAHPPPKPLLLPSQLGKPLVSGVACGQRWRVLRRLLLSSHTERLHLLPQTQQVLEEFGKNAMESNIAAVRDPWFKLANDVLDASLASGGALRGWLFWCARRGAGAGTGAAAAAGGWGCAGLVRVLTDASALPLPRPLRAWDGESGTRVDDGSNIRPVSPSGSLHLDLCAPASPPCPALLAMIKTPQSWLPHPPPLPTCALHPQTDSTFKSYIAPYSQGLRARQAATVAGCTPRSGGAGQAPTNGGSAGQTPARQAGIAGQIRARQAGIAGQAFLPAGRRLLRA